MEFKPIIKQLQAIKVNTHFKENALPHNTRTLELACSWDGESTTLSRSRGSQARALSSQRLPSKVEK